jgi:DNA polymerase III epsilon subunit-like protein
LFFDTETTGVPADFKAPVTNTDNWPRLVQLAWILTSHTGEIIDIRDFVVRPDGFEIPQAATDVHGISNEYAKEKGVDLRNVIKAFAKDLAFCDKIIAHNMEFDKNIIGCEIYRLQQEMLLPIKTTTKEKVCTMLASVEFCKIPGFKNGYKWPKLKELYQKLFGVNFDGEHNALADITATVRCYFELVKRKVIV